MDPNPENDYGINVSKVSLSKKRFKIADVHRLLDDGWCVIPSAIGKDGIHATHAILIFQDQIWDPMNEDLWVSPKDLTGFNAYFPANELNRHIFAFKK
ncbi:hypothetical protein HYZ05_01285 [Candidatus Daviesbacteria bacterium]|nr:hypothetical protein [Candidatus Daviesbacteria bacterium]